MESENENDAQANAELRQNLQRIKRHIDLIAKQPLEPQNFFNVCLSSAFVRTFDFTEYSLSELKAEHALFSLSSLRGSCETVIYLAYVKQLSSEDRQTVIDYLFRREVEQSHKIQTEFFNKIRPSQNVLWQFPFETVNECHLTNIFKNNGFPNLTRKCPPTIEIAKQLNVGQPSIFVILYEFLYRLSSSWVHFNPQFLFRSVWGIYDGKAHYSQHNMARYFLSCCQIYSVMMLCIYTELFREDFDLEDGFVQSIDILRSTIMHMPRWPEPLTFEECNIGIFGRYMEFLEQNHSGSNSQEEIIDNIIKHGFLTTPR